MLRQESALQTEFERRRRIQQRSSLSALIANACGIVLITVYFALTSPGDTLPEAEKTSLSFDLSTLFSLLFPILLLVSGAIWGNRRSKLLSDWYLHQSLENADQPAPPRRGSQELGAHCVYRQYRGTGQTRPCAGVHFAELSHVSAGL